MKAISFDSSGNPVDPNTGQPLDVPPEVAEHLKSLGDAQKNAQEAKTVEDVTNPVESENADEGAKVDAPKEPVSEPKPKESVVPKKTYTKYEVRPDTTFTIEFGVALMGDRYVVVKTDDVQFSKGAEPHWVKFRMWTYKEELEWKSVATKFNEQRRIHTLDNDSLNEQKLRNLLLDWSFGEQEDSLKLLHVGGLLSDEGMVVFHSLFPSVVRYMIEKMNEVLEFNG